MGAFLRKYGTGTGADIYIPIIKRAVVDFAVSADWTPAAGDVKVSKDGGAAANIGTLPTAVTMGNTAMWKFVFADAELQCKVLAITVADSATKAVEDQMLLIETYGHASAMFAPDFGDATALGLSRLDAAVSSRSSHTAANVRTEMDSSSTKLAAIVADTNELQTDWTDGGRLDLILDARASQTSVDDLPTNAELATALGTADDAVLAAIAALNNITAASVWAVGSRTLTSLSGLTVDTVTNLTNLPAITSNWLTAAGLATDAVQEIRDAITGYAGALQTDASGYIKISDGTGTGQIDLTSGGVLVSELATQAKADVNAELVDVVSVDTFALPGNVTPSATPTMQSALAQLFKIGTNKLDQDDTTQNLYNRAGVVDQKRTVSDDGTTLTFGALVAA